MRKSKNQISVIRKIMALILLVVMSLSMLTACGKEEKQESSSAIRIAYQPGVGYAPLIIMKEKNFIEEAYGKPLNVEWLEMKNGAEINESIIAGQLDVGAVGVPVAVTGAATSGMYKIAFGLSSQPFAITTSNPNIKTLADITANDQIAITNYNSIQHILLAKAAKEILGDARALDVNLTKLSNPDGYTAIMSGATSCHAILSPYNFMEVNSKDIDIHEIEVDPSIWPAENSTLVGIANNKFVENNKELYEALLTALDRADTFIKENPAEAAEIIAADYDASSEDIQLWMADYRSNYSTEIHGVMELVSFMSEEGFIEDAPSDIKDIKFDNVKGN